MKELILKLNGETDEDIIISLKEQILKYTTPKIPKPPSKDNTGEDELGNEIIKNLGTEEQPSTKDKILEYYKRALQIVSINKNYSISYLQRKMKTHHGIEIGYNLASKLIERIKEDYPEEEITSVAKIEEIIVSGAEQDPNNPLNYFTEDDKDIGISVILDDPNKEINSLEWVYYNLETGIKTSEVTKNTTEIISPKGINKIQVTCRGLGIDYSGKLFVLKTADGLHSLEKSIIITKKKKKEIPKIYNLSLKEKKILIKTTEDNEINEMIYETLTKNTEYINLLKELEEMGEEINQINFN